MPGFDKQEVRMLLMIRLHLGCWRIMCLCQGMEFQCGSLSVSDPWKRWQGGGERNQDWQVSDRIFRSDLKYEKIFVPLIDQLYGVYPNYLSLDTLIYQVYYAWISAGLKLTRKSLFLSLRPTGLLQLDSIFTRLTTVIHKNIFFFQIRTQKIWT